MHSFQEQFDHFCSAVMAAGESIFYVAGYDLQINNFEMNLVTLSYKKNLNVAFEPIMMDFLLAYEDVVSLWDLRPEMALLRIQLNPANRSVFEDSHGVFVYRLEMLFTYSLNGVKHDLLRFGELVH